MCSPTRKSMNCGKEKEPPLQKLEALPGDSMQEDDCKFTKPKPSAAEMCLPVIQSSSSEASESSTKPIPLEPVKPDTSQPSMNMSVKSVLQGAGLNKALLFLLSFCVPIYGSQQDDQCKPVMVCLPQAPRFIDEDENCRKKEELKPIGLITRNKEADFIGGKFIAGCTCGRKNGLQGDCPRLSCQDNPGCSMNPPRCWPQFKEPKKPVLPPDQNMICVPIELVYYDPSKS